jgi:hypothetical protein
MSAVKEFDADKSLGCEPVSDGSTTRSAAFNDIPATPHKSHRTGRIGFMAVLLTAFVKGIEHKKTEELQKCQHQ